MVIIHPLSLQRTRASIDHNILEVILSVGA